LRDERKGRKDAQKIKVSLQRELILGEADKMVRKKRGENQWE